MLGKLELMKEWRKCFIILAFLFTNSETMSEKSNLRTGLHLCRALGSCLLCLMGNPPLNFTNREKQ